MKKNIIFLGPPGSGKGTQSQRLSSFLGYPPPLVMGDILREAVKNKTPYGLKAKSFMERGELVPDGIIVEIIREKIFEPVYENGFILDGFPRTIRQAESLDKMLKEKNLDGSLLVVKIDLGEEEIIRRLTGRRVCSACGANYHIQFNRPKREGICDACGGKLIQRTDDMEETVRNRLKVYKELTEPLVDYYRKRGVLKEVNGTGEMDEVFKRILKAIQE